MKKFLFLILVIATLPQCGKKESTAANQAKNYALFKTGNVPPQPKQIVVEKPTELAKIPELDFEVQNKTGKTLFVVCFSYIQKEEFARWRWDKSAVYKVEPNTSTFVNVDTIPDDEHRDDVFGYLAIFENEQKANEAIYELVDDDKKIDLDRIIKLHNKKVVVDVEKYGFKPSRLDFAIVAQDKKKLPPELDFAVENQTGKTLFVTGFIYQIKDNVRSVWTYDKTAVLKLEPNQTAMIDVDTIAQKRDRIYMSGFLGVFEEHEEAKAREATYELLPTKNKISLGRLSRLQGQKVIIEVERYGAVGDITEFAIQPAISPIQRMKAEQAEQAIELIETSL